MKRLLIATLILAGCTDDGKTCDYRTNECHTAAEWQAISDRNWRFIECLNSFSGELTVGEADKVCRSKEKAR